MTLISLYNHKLQLLHRILQAKDTVISICVKYPDESDDVFRSRVVLKDMMVREFNRNIERLKMELGISIPSNEQTPSRKE